VPSVKSVSAAAVAVVWNLPTRLPCC